METLLAFLITFAVTCFFVRRYLRTTLSTWQTAPAAGPPHSGDLCPRCSRPIAEGASFCPACGASMALWNVHRAAAVQPAGQPAEAASKPRPVINASLCIGCGSCVDSCPETGTLAIQNGKAILAHAERCVGHAVCVQVCPTSAISLAMGNILQTLKVPLVNESFETNVSGVYIVGELCGMGLIRTAINEGSLAIEGIRRRLESQGHWRPPTASHGSVLPAPEPANGKPYDVVVVGAGPAGLSASLSCLQHGLSYVTLERGEIASTIRGYPRQKFLMAEPVDMPMFGTLYMSDGSKEALLKVWETIVANTGVRIREHECVESVVRENGFLRVDTPKGSYRSKHVVLALGKRGVPRKLCVPGEDLGKVAYQLIEADTYADNDILVVGGGDAAVEAALALSKGGRNRVTLSYRGDSFHRLRDRNRTHLAEAEQGGKMRVLRDSNVVEILPESVRLTLKTGELELPNHYVFVLVGGEPPETFLRKTGIEIVEKVVTA